MLLVDHKKSELFYDVLNETTKILHEKTNNPYLQALIISTNFLLAGEIIEDGLDNAVVIELEKYYNQLENLEFNKEEIRKAYQLCLLMGLKHQNYSLSLITPDSIGFIFAYLADLLLKDKTVDILDGAIGTGNLLITLLNNSNLKLNNIYGIDQNYEYLELALSLANLTDYDIELINQDSRSNLIVPLFDLIIADLPSGIAENNNKLPFMIISNLMQYAKDGGYYLYLIPDDFFTRPGNEIIKDNILSNTYIQALISLPDTMFKAKENKKAILVLQKRGENILPCNEILVLNFPSFQDKDKVASALKRLDVWYRQNKE